MNAMVLVEQTKVMSANNKLQEMSNKDGFCAAVAVEAYAQCLQDLGLLGYDPVKEQEELKKIYDRFHGEEDDLK